jgi:predicted O-methyltransferase YrrM
MTILLRESRVNHFEQLNEKIYHSGILSPELVKFMQTHKKINPNRFEGLHSLFIQHDFKVGLEIGRNSGYSAVAFTTFYPKATLDSIDIRGRHQHKKVFEAMGVADRINIIVGNSTSIPESKIYDYVLIDGDHSYRGAKKDWERIQPHICQGSFVIFDDICRKGPKSVGLLCEELESAIPTTRKICDGMGVVEVPWKDTFL